MKENIKEEFYWRKKNLGVYLGLSYQDISYQYIQVQGIKSFKCIHIGL